MQIRAYLYLMAAAILVPVILFAGFSLRLIEGRESELARTQVAKAAQRAALLVDADLAATQAALRALAGSPSLARGELDAFYREAQAAVGGPDAWAILIDENGRLLFDTTASKGSPATDEAPPVYLSALLGAQRPFVTDLIPSQVSGRLMTGVGMPLRAGGRQYLLGVGHGADHFRQLLLGAGLPQDWQLDIYDRKGKLVASNLGPAALVGQDAPPELSTAETADGILALPLRSGVAGTVAFSRVPGPGWKLAAGAPAAALVP
ncbi:cache domain-containing protein, partial [Massilia sp. Mn16-1_5]|uniref:cache domain-containing protein n=1 Tax=Massilia sp. Mn16-1_5 TaxID=2079199 RepID=UPI00109ECB40